VTGIRGLPLLLLGAVSALGASVEDSPAALRTRVAAELNGDNPWRAQRLADEWAALPGLPAAERAEALVQAAQARSQVGDYAGAEGALKQALNAKPQDPLASFLLAQATRDRPAEALPRAEDAARGAQSPRRRAAAYRLAAEIRLDLGDGAGARADLTRALDQAHDDLDSLVLAATAYGDSPDEALKYARQACAAADAQPSWRRAAAERVCARALSDRKDYAGAMAAAGRALALDPDDSDTLRAILRIKRLSPDEKLPAGGAPGAEKALSGAQARRALAEDPDDFEALRSLAEAARAAGNKAEAADLAERFTAAVRLSPDWERLDAYRLSARLWIELGDARKALASLERAEDLDAASVPNEKLIGRAMGGYIPGAVSEAYGGAAKLRLALGEPAEADATLERGLDLAPENQQLLQLLVERKLAESRPQEARRYAERMLALAKKSSQPAFWNPEKKGLLSGADAAKQGDIDEAQRALDAVDKAIADEAGRGRTSP